MRMQVEEAEEEEAVVELVDPEVLWRFPRVP